METLIADSPFQKKNFFERIHQGQRCDLHNCSARLHHHCARGYFAGSHDEVCMTCKTAWQSSNVVGDDGRAGPDDRQTGKARGKGNGRRKKRAVMEEEDVMNMEHEEGEEEDEQL